MSSNKDNSPTPNKGMAWTPDEFSLLLTGLREKKTMAEIAEAHGRTVNAIKFKALEYACDEVLNVGVPEDKVVEDLGLSKSDLEKELNKRRNLPKVNPVKKILVVKKVKNASDDELTELMTSVNRLQSLLHRYVNKVRLTNK